MIWVPGVWKRHFVQVNGIRIHVAEKGEGPPVLLLHGFPEFWWSWRHQMEALAAAGYRAISPDLRGYGDSDAPPEVGDYDIHHLVQDLAGLLDHLGVNKLPVVGHDWGSILLWQWALLQPERVAAVMSLNVGYAGHGSHPPTHYFSQHSRFNYILYFIQSRFAEAKMAADIPKSVGTIYTTQAADPDFLSEDEREVFYSAFRHSGLRGPINYYRNFDHNWELTPQLRGVQVTQPSLLVTATHDKILTPEMTRGMERVVPNLTRGELDCGHWTQQEKPAEVNHLLLEFLRQLPSWG